MSLVVIFYFFIIKYCRFWQCLVSSLWLEVKFVELLFQFDSRCLSFFRPFEAIIILIKDCLAMVAVTTEKIFRCSLPVVKQPPLHHSQVGTLILVPFRLLSDFMLCHTVANKCTVLRAFGHSKQNKIINIGKAVIGHTIRDSLNNSFHYKSPDGTFLFV